MLFQFKTGLKASKVGGAGLKQTSDFKTTEICKQNKTCSASTETKKKTNEAKKINIESFNCAVLNFEDEMQNERKQNETKTKRHNC